MSLCVPSMTADAPVVRRAASLLLHAARGDIAAFSRCLAEIQGEDNAKDIIIAMALLCQLPLGELQEVVYAEALRENV